jgi:signal peptidase I
MEHLPLWLTRVQSDSMAPRLRDGQLVWTIRSRSKRRLRRGAVVAVESRELSRRIVKRIVGLPGEHLRLEGRKLWVDGRPLADPYALHASSRGTFDVPAGHYLLLGDNRVASNDSRAWRRPYVARTEIVGVLLQRSRLAHLGLQDRLRPTPADI